MIEPLAAPIGYTRVGGIPRIYERLANEPNAVVVELPLPKPRRRLLQRGIHAEFDGALETAGQRIQRLRSGQLLRALQPTERLSVA